MLGCGFKSIIHSVTLRAKDSHGRSERSWKVGVPGHKEGKRNPLSSYFLLHAPPCEVSDICRRGHATGNFFYRGLSRESDFIFLGSKITADGDCSHEIKRHLLLGRKVMTNQDSIFKSKDITLSTKVCLVKAMVFPVVM